MGWQVRENGVVVLVPRYGIEGIVYVAERGDSSIFEYDSKVRPFSISFGSVLLAQEVYRACLFCQLLSRF